MIARGYALSHLLNKNTQERGITQYFEGLFGNHFCEKIQQVCHSNDLSDQVSLERNSQPLSAPLVQGRQARGNLVSYINNIGRLGRADYFYTVREEERGAMGVYRYLSKMCIKYSRVLKTLS